MLTRAKRRRTAVFYGDSNTYGFDPDGGHSGLRYPEDVRWIGILKERLSPEWEILEDSAVGRCIPEMNYELEELDRCLRESLGSTPVGLFAVMLGINDYLSFPRPDPGRVGSRMEAMLLRVRAFYDSKGLRCPRLLVIAPPPADLAGDRFYERFSTTDGRLAKALRWAAQRTGADFIDTAPWELPMSPGDHIHLTAEGHRRFAEHILAELASGDGDGPARMIPQSGA